jgi:hypothetical protein
MTSDQNQIDRLKDQVKNLENQLKVYENHIYILQNDFQFNQKNLQLEQAKHQSQITSLASLILDVFKENRLYEEQRESGLLHRVNNIINLDINDYAGLNALNATSTTNEASLLNSITLNSSTTQPSSSSNNTSSTTNGNNNPRLNSSDQLLSPTPIQSHHSQIQQQQQLQQIQQHNQLSSLHQSFQQPQRNPNRSQQQQQQQHSQHMGQNQNQINNSSHRHSLSGQLLSPSKTQQQKSKSKRLADHSSILDDTLGYTTQKQAPIIPIAPSGHVPISISNSLPSQQSASQDLNGAGLNKRRKVYDKEYSFIKAPSSVEEVWNEYSIGLNNQPSIKTLEMEYKTGWRRDPATSKKFNRRKAIYHAIEKGMSKGYTIDYCIRLLEDFRFIDREKNSKQPIGWLCSGNIPNELR